MSKAPFGLQVFLSSPSMKTLACCKISTPPRVPLPPVPVTRIGECHHSHCASLGDNARSDESAVRKMETKMSGEKRTLQREDQSFKSFLLHGLHYLTDFDI